MNKNVETIGIITDVIKEVIGDSKDLNKVSKGISILSKLSFIYRVLSAKRKDFGQNVQQAYNKSTKLDVPVNKDKLNDLNLRLDIAKEKLKSDN